MKKRTLLVFALLSSVAFTASASDYEYSGEFEWVCKDWRDENGCEYEKSRLRIREKQKKALERIEELEKKSEAKIRKEHPGDKCRADLYKKINELYGSKLGGIIAFRNNFEERRYCYETELLTRYPHERLCDFLHVINTHVKVSDEAFNRCEEIKKCNYWRC
ncbi:TPA: hypothetical protein ACRNDK_002657 [Pseudomonas aeruginosa]